jgi:hypothetical protein
MDTETIAALLFLVMGILSMLIQTQNTQIITVLALCIALTQRAHLLFR